MFRSLLSAALIVVSIADISAEDIAVRPQPAEGPLDNPLKGWCPYPNAGPIHQPYSMVFQYSSWRKAFPDKSLMVRNANGYAGRQEWIGFHDDMFPEDTDNGKDWSFLAGLKKANRAENWNVAVVGGEMVPGKAEHWLGQNFDMTLSMLERSHFTWVGPYCPALTRTGDEQFFTRSEQLVRRMGYEFQITEVTHSESVKAKEFVRLSLKGRNLGVAPFYYPWSVEWALLDSSGNAVSVHKTDWDIRTWQPGEFAECTEFAVDIPPGKYRLGLGIRDPWRNRPAIGFANDLNVTNGWTLVSEIQIAEQRGGN